MQQPLSSRVGCAATAVIPSRWRSHRIEGGTRASIRRLQRLLGVTGVIDAAKLPFVIPSRWRSHRIEGGTRASIRRLQRLLGVTQARLLGMIQARLRGATQAPLLDNRPHSERATIRSTVLSSVGGNASRHISKSASISASGTSTNARSNRKRCGIRKSSSSNPRSS